MRRSVLLVASVALAVLLASGAALAQTTDTTPPETTLTQKPNAFSTDVSPTFSFTSNDATATFECQMDAGAYESCTSPKQYFLLSEGQHTFRVRATDASANADPTAAEYTWTVDSLDPKITFTERPGTATGSDEWDTWVTNDTSPTWAWTIEDANPNPARDRCYLYDDTNDRYILNSFSCATSSPYTFGGVLPDAEYYFSISAEDKAGNYDSATNYFEVDTVAPSIVSFAPTGKSVRPSANVVVTFDDELYGSGRSVNIYRSGSSTPLAVDRYFYDGENEVEIAPKKNLTRGTKYTVEVTTGVNDGANSLAAAKSWSFKTR